MMKRIKTTTGVVALSGALLAGGWTSSANSATVQTDIEVNFPSILIVYYYDTIDLTATAAGIANLLGVSATDCATPGPGDFCDTEGTLTDGTLDLSGSPTVVGSIAGTLPGSSTSTVTVTNAYGMRCLGCTSYNVSVADGASSNAIGNPGVSDSAPAANGLTLVTGDLDFEIDLAQVTSAAETETVTFTITASP